MKPEVKKKWLEALRSGKYGQCRQRLSDGTAFCCLGVLCELAVEAGVVEKKTVTGNIVEYGGDVSLLPKEVLEWAGLANPTPCDSSHDGISLVALNDGGNTFAHIADVIEEQDDDWVGNSKQKTDRRVYDVE